jgi:hypothetical protein
MYMRVLKLKIILRAQLFTFRVSIIKEIYLLISQRMPRPLPLLDGAGGKQNVRISPLEGSGA